MKKFLSLLIVLSIVLLPNVFAEELISATATESNAGEIVVTGKAKTAVVAVDVIIKDEAGNLVKLVTTGVQDDDSFEAKVTLAPKKYFISVADYNGGKMIELVVEPDGEAATASGKVKNAATYDPIIISVAILAVSVAGIVGSTVYFVKSKQK